MVGRLGHPNSGRLTTSALLKTNKVSAAAADGFFRIPYKSALTIEALRMAPAITSTWTAASTLTDTVGVTESYLELLFTVLGELVETIGIDDEPFISPVIVVSDGVRIAEQMLRGFNMRLTQTFRLSEAVARGPGGTLSDALTMADVSAQAWTMIIEELVRLSSVTPGPFSLTINAAERVRIEDNPALGYLRTLTETIGIDDTLALLRGVRVVESLRLSPAVSTTLKYGITNVEQLRVMDSLRRFFAGDVSDTVGISLTPVTVKLVRPTVSEGIGIDDSQTPKFFLRAIAADTIGIDDSQILRMLLRPTLEDGIELAAAYLSPGNEFTTWAINTRNAAVTEYTNYAFNSFAQVGNKYWGASSTGLYELGGDTDAGTDIIAQIKSGFAQFGGSRFTSFKAAYLGMRGEGDFVLKLETGDGKTYNYAVVGKDMQTTKVHMGKGLRARYFAFELISTGQDFDLDDIEFMPLVAQRRV